MTIKDFEVPEKLKTCGITSMKLLDDKKFGRYIKANYNGHAITATFDPSDITATMNHFRKQAGTYISFNGVAAKDIIKDLVMAMTTETDKYIEECIISQDTGAAQEGDHQQEHEIRDAIVMKYTADPELMDKRDIEESSKGEGIGIDTENEAPDGDADNTNSSTPATAALWEAVRIGGSYFLISYDPLQKRVKLTNNIRERSGRTILPYTDAGIDPYVFTDKQELENFIELAKRENLGTLFRKVQRYVRLFYDTDNQAYIDLVTSDIIFTYFQDRLGKTHYLFIYGDPGTGKGAVLDTITQLGYRTADVTSVTGPVLYRIMGSVERGQVTMLIDEANKLEDDELLLNVLKVGYKGQQRVPRILDNERNIVEWFYAYCFKVIAAEKLPAHWKTGGFLSRCLVIHSAPGDPEIDIGDVLERANDSRNAKILKQLTDLRKLLFAYRLLHYHEPIRDIKIKGIRGRDRELIKPLVRLFKTHGEETSLEAVRNALYYFVKERNKEVTGNFTAAMHTLIKNKIAENGGKNYELYNSEIWDSIKKELKAEDIEDKQGTVKTELFGEVSTKRLAGVLRSLGGKPGRDSSGERRVWSFDQQTLDRFNSVYRQVPDSIEIEDMSQQTTLFEERDNFEEGLLFSDTSDSSDSF
jgi:hypothetical protein